MERYTLAVLVDNKFGVLSRVAGLFSRRGFNIHSLSVGTTDDPTLSRMTIVVEGDEHTRQQLTKQLDKLVNVLKVEDLTDQRSVERELAVIKVRAEASQRAAIVQMADVFRAKVVDVSKRTIVVEITGDQEKIEALMELLREFGILEIVRTGKVALARGTSILRAPHIDEEAV